MKEQFTLNPSCASLSSENITSKLLKMCRTESFSKPQDQDCKFCGQSFNTWKKYRKPHSKPLGEISLFVSFMLENRPASRLNPRVEATVRQASIPPPLERPSQLVKRQKNVGLFTILVSLALLTSNTASTTLFICRTCMLST